MFNKNELRAQMARAGITAKALAEQLGINESTLYRKISEDGRFTRKEINDIIRILNIEDPKPIFLLSSLRLRK